MLPALLELIIHPASWALQGLESPLSVVSCRNQRIHHDIAKSQFIRNSVPPDLAKTIKVGHGLKSETDRVQPISWVAEDGTRIKLVDTPGFDDSREGVTDAEVLKMIATFLTKE